MSWQGLPRLVATTVWTNLPLLLAIDVCMVVAAVPALVAVLVGGHLAAPLIAAVTLGPLWAATVATTDRMVRDEPVSLQAFGSALRRHAGRGVRLGVVAGTAVTAFLGTVATLAVNPGQRWLLVPLAADGAVMVLLGLVGLTAFTLTTSGGLRGWVLVRVALEAVTAHRMPVAGAVALIVLIAALVSWVPGTSAVVPAPLAVFLSAWTMRAYARFDLKPGERVDDD
ncbi:MAG: hypothetical protein ACRDP8_13330 [Actinopolymorphaceae bacterium]